MNTLLQLFIIGLLIVTFSFNISNLRLQNRINTTLAQRIALLEACSCEGNEQTEVLSPLVLETWTRC